jgi:hypothetical protein
VSVRICLLAALAAFCTTTEVTGAEPYRDPNVHFSLEIPDGWQMMPAEEIQQLNDAIEGLNPGKGGRYHAGFRRRGVEPFTLPYVLLQVIPGRYAATHAEVKKTLARQFGTPGSGIGPPVLSADRDQFQFHFHSATPDGQRTRGIGVGRLGAEATVLLWTHSADDTEAFARDNKTFTPMTDSARFDEGHTFTPTEPLSDLRRFFTPGSVGVPLAVIGLVVLLLYKISRVFARPAWNRY